MYIDEDKHTYLDNEQDNWTESPVKYDKYGERIKDFDFDVEDYLGID
ncbi:MAG: hypothetical protein LBN22_02605 [Clostridiales Family XIII bacterium]|nr:hypothetical protein [Clostridiales Family XIII bacterium]